MKARLRKPVEGLEVDTIYDYTISAACDETFVLDIDDDTFRESSHWTDFRYDTMDDLLEDWELLQPVSDTTKQAIRLQLEHLQRLQTDLAWRWRTNDEMTHEQHEQEWDDIKDQQWEAIVSVLEGKE